MLDLPAASTPAPPPHWRLAPLPGAPLCLPRADRLALAGGHDSLAASPALLAALAAAAAPGATLAAYDSSGAAWRLRRADAAQPLWQVQALAESRARLLTALRGLLGPRLSGCLLHELRSPLNALSLHAELIERTLLGRNPVAAVPRALDSVAVIRERLRDLGRRQDAMAALWLGGADNQGAALAGIVEHSLQLLRGHLSLQGIRLRGAGLEALGTVRLAQGAAEVELVLLTLLLAASEGARHNRVGAGEAEVLLVAENGAQGPSLELQAPCETATLGSELAGTDGAGLLAALALLLEPSGLRLEAEPAEALIRLRLPQA
jgi:signal transduction histidine kinase